MSKRERIRSNNRLRAENTAPLTLEDVDKQLYSDILDNIQDQRMVAKPIGIFEISPDDLQPRRVVPASVRREAGWVNPPADTDRLFRMWTEVVEAEIQHPFDVHQRLALAYDSDSADEAREPHPFELSLLRVIELAGSIQRDGLSNPVTVVRDGNGFRLETGERRWLAYHLLYHYARDGKQKWASIPARTVESKNVWRQAFENNARDDLNAVGRARQLALLVMNLYSRDGHTFRSIDDFEHEREFYAQVANGQKNVRGSYPVPYGKGDLILAAMGLKNSVQIRQYRALLRLDNALWEFADERNLTEGEIRKLTEARTVTGVTVLAEVTKKSIVAETGIGSKKHYQNTLKLIKKASPGNDEHNRKAIDNIRELISWLEEQQSFIENM